MLSLFILFFCIYLLSYMLCCIQSYLHVFKAYILLVHAFPETQTHDTGISTETYIYVFVCFVYLLFLSKVTCITFKAYILSVHAFHGNQTRYLCIATGKYFWLLICFCLFCFVYLHCFIQSDLHCIATGTYFYVCLFVCWLLFFYIFLLSICLFVCLLTLFYPKQLRLHSRHAFY